MRRLLIFFTAAFLLTVTHANAQELIYGLKGGLNVSKLHVSSDGDGNVSSDSKVNVVLGGYLQTPFTSSISNLIFQPELLLSFEGGKTGGVKINTTFINAPLLAKYYLMEDKGFYLEAGPQLSLLLSSKVKVDGESEDSTDELNRFGLGFGFGLGYELDNGIGFDVRYNLGLTKLNENDGDFDMTGRTFQFTVSYRL
ncbi:MAG: PorT family protein [Cytophagales bacterium]|nr:PorT family protein [Cytophagales bacterium]